MFWTQKSFIANIYTVVPLTRAVSVWGLAKLLPLRGEIDDGNQTVFFGAVLLIYNEYLQSYASPNLAETTRGSFWTQFKNSIPRVPLTWPCLRATHTKAFHLFTIGFCRAPLSTRRVSLQTLSCCLWGQIFSLRTSVVLRFTFASLGHQLLLPPGTFFHKGKWFSWRWKNSI